MKKQLAVLMAAATAVTTVAPVLASAEVKEIKDASASQVNADIKKALDTKYADKKQDGVNVANSDDVEAYMNSRYAVLLSGDGLKEEKDKGLLAWASSEYSKVNPAVKFDLNGVDVANTFVVTDASKVTGIVEKEVLAGRALKVFVVDKGIKDNSSVFKTNNKLYGAADTDTEVSLENAYNAVKTEKFVKSFDDANKKITLTSGAVIELKAGAEAYDFKKAFAADGQSLDLTKEANNQQSVLDTITKFDVQKNKDEKTVTRDVMSGDTVLYTVTNVQNSVIDVPTVYTNEAGYTEKGADLVNKLINANKDTKAGKAGKFNYDGVNYVLTAPIDYTNPNAVIEKIGDKYVLKFKAQVRDANDELSTRTIQFNIEGKVQKDLVRVLNDLRGETEVVVGHFVKLAGADRFATAIEVSNQRFEKGKADSVVIVGATALMDGLSAVPLASAKNAPILLADAKNGLSADTVAEIKRATKDLNRKTVYIVGGTNSVPTSVDKALQEKFGAVVVRLSGTDRYETSLDVARRLGYDKVLNKNAYVVGGEGAADAMSISSVAAKVEQDTVSPVLVVPQKGISRNTRDFVSSLKLEKAFVIGGESSVSTQVLSDLSKVSPDVERISGADRYATNVNVLKKFFSKDQVVDKTLVKGLVVTSGDTKFLVDSQTAGALAAKNDAPILLTGNKLTSDQLSLFKDGELLSGLASLSGRTSKVFQVGGVVSADVMKAIVEKLGL
ncbi:cell wall-binding repeat-containing protein [Peptostreptococcus porci]|uniref:cell wall-binding repeat-containing protein n=1 Tax=Peptostreptococcus porci TaxID=2652282 RepID=UPI002A74C132|nr:cell wall-binding repeat-containing protein [Peptostreptococcus porci]MDY2794142.1 cell wall-binding repeat-containing protein [Peptostreptococcus porci]